MFLLDNIIITEGKTKDILGIIEVLRGTIKGDFEYGNKSFEENIHEFFEEIIKSKYQTIYVAKNGGDVFGFAYFVNLPPNNGMCWLEMFAVAKDFQKKGIGLKLVRESCDLFVELEKQKGIYLRTIVLTTNKANSRAQSFYSKAGFVISEDFGGEIRGFVGKGNKEVVMIKPIGDAVCPRQHNTKEFDSYGS